MSMVHFVHAAVAAGLVATVLFDFWQRLLHAATGIPPTNWGLVGRWFAHMPRGRFKHEAIADAPPVENEAAIGWAMHYLIGQIYGFVYLAVAVALPVGRADGAERVAVRGGLGGDSLVRDAAGAGAGGDGRPGGQPRCPALHGAGGA